MSGARTVFPSPNFKEGELFSANFLSGRLFGLKISGGAAVPGYSPSKIACTNAPVAAQKGYLSPSGDLYLYYSGAVYRSTGASGAFFKAADGFSAAPYFAACTEGDSDFVIISGGDKSVCATSSAVSADEFPEITCGVVHYNRLFGIDADDARVIRWSAAGDVHDDEESLRGAGYIRLDAQKGDVLSLVPYDDKLIAVRKYGLTVLRVYGDVSDFRVQYSGASCEEVVANTAAVCAGKLLFFTAGGLMCFDGEGIEPFEADGLSGFSSPSSAVALGGEYFVCGQLDGEAAIACIDCAQKVASYISDAADCICADGRAVYFNGNLYELETGSSGVWDSGETDLGEVGLKYLSKLHICGSIQKITVQWRGRSHTFSGDVKEVKVGALSETFRIIIECSRLEEVRAEFIKRG